MNQEEKAEQIRTRQQNKALHLYYTKLARAFNEQGIGLKVILSRAPSDAPATKYGMKEYIWRPFQEQMLGKRSTKELLKREEIDSVYDAVNKFVSENWHFSIPFPSIDELLFEMRKQEELKKLSKK